MNNRLKFFTKNHEYLTLKQIIDLCQASVVEGLDLGAKIYDISTLKLATGQDISFLSADKYFSKLKDTKTGFCLLTQDHLNKVDKDLDIIFIVVKDPYYAYCQIVREFYSEKSLDRNQNSNIHPLAKIGEGSVIYPGAFIGQDVEIGKNCIIGPNSVITNGCFIGDGVEIGPLSVISFANIGNDCLIHNGVKIGQDGFGFCHREGKNHKIIQIGIVEIGNNVEIGANSCIDRGAIENTIIEDDVKIDNLVQVAHNVKIGRSSVVAGCAALAGSCEIGKYVQIGGNASISGHIKINDGAKVAGMSGVMNDIKEFSTVAGIPAIPIRDWHRVNAKTNRDFNINRRG